MINRLNDNSGFEQNKQKSGLLGGESEIPTLNVTNFYLLFFPILTKVTLNYHYGIPFKCYSSIEKSTMTVEGQFIPIAMKKRYPGYLQL